MVNNTRTGEYVAIENITIADQDQKFVLEIRNAHTKYKVC